MLHRETNDAVVSAFSSLVLVSSYFTKADQVAGCLVLLDDLKRVQSLLLGHLNLHLLNQGAEVRDILAMGCQPAVVLHFTQYLAQRIGLAEPFSSFRNEIATFGG